MTEANRMPFRSLRLPTWLPLLALPAAFACSDGAAPPSAPPASPSPVEAGPVPDHGPPGHVHESQHGGRVQTVGDRHVEAVLMPDGVLFYVSDSVQSPVSLDGYSGSAVVQGPSGIATVPLLAMGDHLHAAAKLVHGAPASVVLTLTRGSAAVSVAFDTASVGLQAHDHTSLHGGVVSMSGDTHLEYAASGDAYEVWVSDAMRVAITKDVRGSLTDGGVVVPLTFDPATGLLRGKGAGAGSRPVMVDVTVGDVAFSLGFNAAR